MRVQAAVSYALLYPPVQSTLLCLSKLYRAVDPKIFSGLAQEAVSACALSIQQAARQVRKDILKGPNFLREGMCSCDLIKPIAKPYLYCLAAL